MKNLKLISTNIRYENSYDGPLNWPFRAEFLSGLILGRSPLVIGSQEGRRPQLLDFELRLTDFNLIDSHREWIEERMYPCLFVNFNDIQVIESGDFWLSETPNVLGSKSFGSTFPRLCTWAHLKFIASGEEMIIANTHLDHILESTRTMQAQVLGTELLNIKNRKNLDLVLMGDFNESPNHPFKQKLCETLSLVDPWFELGLPEESSHYSFAGNEISDGKRIDWILVPRTFSHFEIELLKDKSPEGIYPSDHFPLFFSGNTHP